MRAPIDISSKSGRKRKPLIESDDFSAYGGFFSLITEPDALDKLPTGISLFKNPVNITLNPDPDYEKKLNELLSLPGFWIITNPLSGESKYFDKNGNEVSNPFNK